MDKIYNTCPLIHYVTNCWVIKQKVCSLMLLAKSMAGEEIACQIIMVLYTELGISFHLLIAAMRG